MFGIFLFAVTFCLLCSLTSKGTPAPVAIAVAEAPAPSTPAPARAATLAAPVATCTIPIPAPAPSSAGQAPVSRYAKMNVDALRRACSQAAPRITWRDAHGRNKHLKKPEMIAALEAQAQP